MGESGSDSWDPKRRQLSPSCKIYLLGYIHLVAWEVEYTDELEDWWDDLSEAEQESVDAYVRLLEEKGPTLPHPYSSGVVTSRHGHMRELRIQHAGRPYRVLYAFDPRQAAILLIGGDKTGNDRWYEEYVPKADALYDEHLRVIAQEETRRGKKV